MSNVISFMYRNHRNQVRERTIEFECVEYIKSPGFGYEPGWFISGHCRDKDARRSFALVNIIVPEGDGLNLYKLLDWRKLRNE